MTPQTEMEGFALLVLTFTFGDTIVAIFPAASVFAKSLGLPWVASSSTPRIFESGVGGVGSLCLSPTLPFLLLLVKFAKTEPWTSRGKAA